MNSCCSSERDTLLTINKEELCSKCKKRVSKRKDYETHKEKRLATGKTWRMKNIEHCKERDNKYHQEHKKERNESCKKYYELNKEKIKEQRKIYRQNNKDKQKLQVEKFLSKPGVRVSNALRLRVRRFLGSGKTYLDLISCDKDFLKKWFEFNFELDSQHEMSFDNFGKVWEIDHVLPCSSFNMEDEIEQKKCFNWKNLAPLLCSVNKIKNKNILFSHNLRQEIRLKLFLKQQTLTTADQK